MKGESMKETPQQYVKRILGYVEGKDPLKIQKSTAKKLQKLIKPLSRKQLRRRPAPEKWSIAEILAHLADTEVVGSWRMRLIMGSDGTPILGFDQDVWAKTFAYADRDPKHSLKVFRVLRENNLSLLKSIPPKLWEYHGMHSERGKETIAHTVRMFAGHDLNHLQQIEKIAKSGHGKR
jgi:DinB superfamily